MRSCIGEHLQSSDSHVHRHVSTHGVANVKNFKWKILAIQSNTNARLVLESHFIKRMVNIMNGCEGAQPLLFL